MKKKPQYKFPYSDAKTIHRFGVDITLYSENVPNSSVAYEEVTVGHLEEFYDDTSTFMWFIIEGKGTFVINDEKIEVAAKDLIVIPPGKRIHYFGTMKMLLCVTPAFDRKHEHHVRNVASSESPYH